MLQDSETAARLSAAIRSASGERHAEASRPELTARLFALPAFRAFQEDIRREIMKEVAHSLARVQ